MKVECKKVIILGWYFRISLRQLSWKPILEGIVKFLMDSEEYSLATQFGKSNCFTIVFHSSVVQNIYDRDFFIWIILYPVAIDFELWYGFSITSEEN